MTPAELIAERRSATKAIGCTPGDCVNPRISVAFDVETFDRLATLADEDGISFASLVRRIIKENIDRY